MTNVTPIFGTKRGATKSMQPKTVTINNDKFGINFSGSTMKLIIAPHMLQAIAQGLIPEPRSEAQKIFLIQYLNLSNDICEVLEDTVMREEITFAEALTYHLAMIATT
jgi:hypothetical protein